LGKISSGNWGALTEKWRKYSTGLTNSARKREAVKGKTSASRRKRECIVSQEGENCLADGDNLRAAENVRSAFKGGEL